MADGYARYTNKPQAVIIHVDVVRPFIQCFRFVTGNENWEGFEKSQSRKKNCHFSF